MTIIIKDNIENAKRNQVTRTEFHKSDEEDE